jgi:hypothetical protein
MDSLDLYGRAEEEDPECEESEQRDVDGSRFRTFMALQRFDVLIAMILVGDEEAEDEENEEATDDGIERPMNSSEISEALENFNKVIQEKNRVVRLTYKYFPDRKAMMTYWKATTSVEALR